MKFSTSILIALATYAAAAPVEEQQKREAEAINNYVPPLGEPAFVKREAEAVNNYVPPLGEPAWV